MSDGVVCTKVLPETLRDEHLNKIYGGESWLVIFTQTERTHSNTTGLFSAIWLLVVFYVAYNNCNAMDLSWGRIVRRVWTTPVIYWIV